MVVSIAIGALLYLGGAVMADLDRVGGALEDFILLHGLTLNLLDWLCVDVRGALYLGRVVRHGICRRCNLEFGHFELFSFGRTAGLGMRIFTIR